MSSGEVRRVSRQDIQLVQNLIERCLQLYMNQKEVVETLLDQARIEPGFTELVWQKLEEENREFFKAYHVRLKVKHQIMIFNKLLEQQVELMREICPAGVAPITVSNGSSYSSSLNQPPCFVPEPTIQQASTPDNVHHRMGCPPSTLMNGGPPMHPNMQTTTGGSALAAKMDIVSNMHPTQTPQMGVLHAMNGTTIKPEPGYSNCSAFSWNERDGNVMDARTTIGDPCVTSFNGPDPNSQPLHEPSLLDADASSFGFLGQIPRNFSLSDLTADFSQSSDILGSYSRSPFLATDDFLDSPGRECQGDNKRLDTISEGRSLDDFGSD
ncbi:hypothetical protein H6P81_004138 [Aristolochia fimbriata]|uniref:Uncharacterized protein n=1 Tax=Aristolochia fimbriata TaxID=158543 RepID=A0AAV7FEK4_ARIFI|nr:hypothetical protein H6P81_004138 [Aristolochia fimbriata]